MPELPEVETTARLIQPHLVGRVVEAARVNWLRTLGGLSASRFERAVIGAQVRAVGRRAKWVVMELERDGEGAGALLVHLRMTGRLVVEPAESDPGPWARVALGLDGGRELRFLDVRKFGRMLFVEDPLAHFVELGPEPLGESFTAEWLSRELRARRRALKPLLLDQTFVAGLGNIYVDESLFAAGLHPLRRSDTVTPERARVLHAAIQRILAEAIEREGSSFDVFYRTPEGQPGAYQHLFQVYGRDGSACNVCGRVITKLVVGQRGTHVCTRCQPKPRAR
ncbi:MAG: bifunctional DNA-formamidopyrimidine glycosylase/DNA-(apurinic or apyrimidinic site) lyase [Planctomycetota bacterium]